MAHAPCYISLDATNRCVFVANYMSGTVTVYPVEAGGGLGVHAQLVKHEGQLGPQADRQEAAACAFDCSVTGQSVCDCS